MLYWLLSVVNHDQGTWRRWSQSIMMGKRGSKLQAWWLERWSWEYIFKAHAKASSIRKDWWSHGYMTWHSTEPRVGPHPRVLQGECNSRSYYYKMTSLTKETEASAPYWFCPSKSSLRKVPPWRVKILLASSFLWRVRCLFALHALGTGREMWRAHQLKFASQMHDRAYSQLFRDRDFFC